MLPPFSLLIDSLELHCIQFLILSSVANCQANHFYWLAVSPCYTTPSLTPAPQ